MRGAISAALDMAAPSGMSGGRKKRPMSISAMTVQSHLAKLKRHQQSGGALFIDGANAFYSAARCFLFKTQDGQGLTDWVNQLPIRACLKERLMLLMMGPTLLDRLGVAASIKDMLSSTFTATWFSVVLDSPQVFRTQEGTIPGSPLADLLFQVIMTVALDATIALEDAGLRVCVPVPRVDGAWDSVASPLPTWLDDAAILLESSSAGQLTEDTANAATIAFGGLQMISIDMNFQAGKSEAVLHFAGQGSKHARHQLLVEDGGLVRVKTGTSFVQLR